MDLILLTSIVLRVAALAWSVVVFARIRHWRVLFVTAMLALMATPQILAAWVPAGHGRTGSGGSWFVELLGLAVSVMAFLVVVSLEDLFASGKAQRGWAASTRRVALTAILAGGLTVVGCAVTGYLAYDMSRRELQSTVAGQNLAMARTLAQHAVSHIDLAAGREPARRLLYRELETLWSEAAPHPEGSYLCILEPPGTIAVHTAAPQQRGISVRHVPIPATAGGAATTVGGLLEEGRDWSGTNHSHNDVEQLVGFAYLGALDVLVAVHTPAHLIERQVRAAAKPWATGLAVIGGLLVPLSIGLLYHSFSLSQRRARAGARRRRELEDQLRQSQKMEAVGRLAGGIAHDFNNLLMAIMGNVEQVRDKLPPSSDAPGAPGDENVLEIERACERAAALTRQLLAFSRKETVRVTVLDLNATVIDTERMLRRLIGEDIALHLLLEGQLQRLRGDPGLVEQVILNLAVNARDAMPSGGTLCIETRNVRWRRGATTGDLTASTPGVSLLVSDTGSGMKPEVRERIFEPFFTTKSRERGTGLGLSTVYGIVKMLGGDIEVQSEPGRGSTFALTFPATEEAPATAQAVSPAPVPIAAGVRILVCEDDRSVRDLIGAMLEKGGYEVLCADSGASAMDLARSGDRTPELLVTDIVLPDTDGRALARTLCEQIPQLKTLYVSGYATDVIGQRADLDPEEELLRKPFSSQALLAKVEEILRAGRV